jgi:hypothetical protein
MFMGKIFYNVKSGWWVYFYIILDSVYKFEIIHILIKACLPCQTFLFQLQTPGKKK